MFKKISATLRNFKLAKQLTLLLILIFIGGIVSSGVVLASILNYKAQNEISSNAWLLIQTLNSVRDYTNTEVNPTLSARLKNQEFLPQVVPAYSANKIFEKLRIDNKEYSDFFYKEAMLNPTNVRDKADDFELGLVQRFRQSLNLKEVHGFRSVGGEKIFYIAHPLAIIDAKCLKCHSTPDVAPKKMIDIYGKKNGFNWKLNDIHGVQILSMPASRVFHNARQSFVLVMGIVISVFAVILFMANFWLKQFIVRPIKQIVQIADAVSTGDMDANFEKASNDEMGSLVEAFTRMKLSLVMALKRFDRNSTGIPKPDEQ